VFEHVNQVVEIQKIDLVSQLVQKEKFVDNFKMLEQLQTSLKSQHAEHTQILAQINAVMPAL